MSAPFMQLYVADYLGDTQHLSAEEHGAYLLLLMTMWRHDGKLPNDPTKLCRIARVHPPRWARVAESVMPFFVVTEDGFITQKRLLIEHEKSSHKSQSRSIAGAAGGRAKALKDKKPPLANASDLPQHLPDIRYQKEEDYTPNGVLSDASASDLAVRKKRSNEAYPPEFDALWSSYPTDRNMSKKAAFSVWRRLGKPEQAEALASCPAFKAFCADDATYRPVHLVRFLREHRFKGFLEAPRGPSPSDFDSEGNWLGPRHLRKPNGTAVDPAPGSGGEDQKPGNAPVLRGRGELHRELQGHGGSGPELRRRTQDNRVAPMGVLFEAEDWEPAVGHARGQGRAPH